MFQAHFSLHFSLFFILFWVFYFICLKVEIFYLCLFMFVCFPNPVGILDICDPKLTILATDFMTENFM